MNNDTDYGRPLRDADFKELNLSKEMLHSVEAHTGLLEIILYYVK